MLFPRTPAGGAEPWKFQAVLATKPDRLRNKLREALIATGVSPKEIEERLGLPLCGYHWRNHCHLVCRFGHLARIRWTQPARNRSSDVADRSALASPPGDNSSAANSQPRHLNMAEIKYAPNLWVSGPTFVMRTALIPFSP